MKHIPVHDVRSRGCMVPFSMAPPWYLFEGSMTRYEGSIEAMAHPRRVRGTSVEGPWRVCGGSMDAGPSTIVTSWTLPRSMDPPWRRAWRFMASTASDNNARPRGMSLLKGLMEGLKRVRGGSMEGSWSAMDGPWRGHGRSMALRGPVMNP